MQSKLSTSKKSCCCCCWRFLGFSYFGCVVSYWVSTISKSAAVSLIPPSILSFFCFFFWFLLPQGHKGIVFLETYVLTFRYQLFVADNNMIACTMPSRVKVLLENEDQCTPGFVCQCTRPNRLSSIRPDVGI